MYKILFHKSCYIMIYSRYNRIKAMRRNYPETGNSSMTQNNVAEGTRMEI